MRKITDQEIAFFDESVKAARSPLYQHALHVRKESPFSSDDESFTFEVPRDLPVWLPGDPIDLHVPRIPPQSE